MNSICYWSLLLASLLVILCHCDCKLLGAFVLPHGGIALNPSQFHSPSRWAQQYAWTIHRAAVEVGRHIRELRADVILLSTPHGVADWDRVQLYMNGRANGTASTDNCQCPPCCYDVQVDVDWQLGQQLIQTLRANKAQVGATAFHGPVGSMDEPSELKWGEVIPLTFIKDLVGTKLIFLSQPARRYNESVQMIPDLLQFGRLLYGDLESLNKTVVVVISADLAHTHEKSGPYGFSPAAEPFDRNVGDWAATLHPAYLLQNAASFANDAESCGFTGLVLLHGMLEAGKLGSWTPVLHANFHPSYYGMMVASFSRKQQCSNATKCPDQDSITSNRT